MNRFVCLAILAVTLACSATGFAQGDSPVVEPLFVTVDLNLGEKRDVELADGSTATVKLLDLVETRDDIRQAVRRAEATVEINGVKAQLVAAMYRLPIEVGGVQVDCPVTRGYTVSSSKKNVWSLDHDVRLRLWPKGSPWIRPDTFAYPVRGRWFASDTQMGNDPCYVDGGELPTQKSIYYHHGLDVGGVEGQTVIQAATDGVVVSVAGEFDESYGTETQISPRGDVVYLQDARGWHYRYSHLHSIDPAIKLGSRVKKGQRIGLLGKEGASGGWSHLHFGISSIQPNGEYGCLDAYAFYWQAAHEQQNTVLQAVARPHLYTRVGQPVTLDGSRSFSRDGVDAIRRYRWNFTDGTKAEGVQVTHTYDKPGTYSEILRVVDIRGRVDYDFAVVQVVDLTQEGNNPPAIHAAYEPTLGIKPGDQITFKVRSFRVRPDEGQEEWDFGDGTARVKVQSDGCAVKHAPDGYAVTTHAYEKPGHYLVRVQRTNDRGETAVGRLHVRVEAEE